MSNTFESIKYQVANIQFHFLEMNQEKTAIEANPSTHRIAQYIEILLKEKDGEIETLKAENSKMRNALTKIEGIARRFGESGTNPEKDIELIEKLVTEALKKDSNE